MYFVSFLICFVLTQSIIAKEEDVFEYSDGDFNSRLAEHETALVMFYAPWCGHCKRLKPEYAKAAEDLKKNDPPVALVKVDCTEAGKDTCSKHGISGYPTLKIFRSGEFSQDYSGPREAAGMVKYMKAQVGPSAKEIKNIEELEKFRKPASDVTVVGFFEKESDLKTIFFKVADKLREKVQFAYSTHQEVLDKQGLKDGIVLFRPAHMQNKFEENFVAYSGGASVAELSDFITENYHGLVGHRKPDNKQDFNNPLIVAYYSVDYIKNIKGTNYWRNRVLKVAQSYKDKTNFAISSKDEFQHELNEFGIDFVKDDKPVVLAKNIKEQKFIMKDDFSVQALEQFVKDILEDNLEPFLKSEPIPDSNDEPVKVAVAKNFDEVVTNNGKDTLIEFYAPWCGHCKKLAPTFDELALKLKDEDVAIVKMDATANDVPALYEVHGFPTLYWAGKESKGSPVKYEGGREVDDFIKYISTHATNELKNYDRKGNSKPDKTEL